MRWRSVAEFSLNSGKYNYNVVHSSTIVITKLLKVNLSYSLVTSHLLEIKDVQSGIDMHQFETLVITLLQRESLAAKQGSAQPICFHVHQVAQVIVAYEDLCFDRF